MGCGICRFWLKPKPMAAGAERVAITRGVNRDGACHRFPVATRTAASHFCGEYKAGLSIAPVEPEADAA